MKGLIMAILAAVVAGVIINSSKKLTLEWLKKKVKEKLKKKNVAKVAVGDLKLLTLDRIASNSLNELINEGVEDVPISEDAEEEPISEDAEEEPIDESVEELISEDMKDLADKGLDAIGVLIEKGYTHVLACLDENNGIIGKVEFIKAAYTDAEVDQLINRTGEGLVVIHS